MPQAIYLDSNCLAYLTGQQVFDSKGWSKTGTENLLRAVNGALIADRIVLYGSHFHLEEASRIHDVAARRTFVDSFWNLVKWNMLMASYDMALKEAELHRPLEGAEPFEEFWRRQALRKASRDAAEFNEIAQKVTQFVDTSVASSKARRDTVIARLTAEYAHLTPGQVTQRWWKEADAKIENWVGDYIEKSKEHLGLSEDRATWPTPRDLPTAWAIHAYQMARAVMNVGLAKKIGDGDAHDTYHYASACYADVFVTEDGAFKDTLAIIPNNPITVLSFQEFAAQFDIAPS